MGPHETDNTILKPAVAAVRTCKFKAAVEKVRHMRGKIYNVYTVNSDLAGFMTSPLMSSLAMYYRIEKKPQNLTLPNE